VPINGQKFSIGKLFYVVVIFLNRYFYSSWISELINLSHKQGTLYFHNLYDILPQYESKNLTEKLENNWFDELKRYPDRASLFHATIRTMR